MKTRRKAYVRGVLVTAVVFAAGGTIAFLMLRELADRGDIAIADDVQALEIGVYAFVLFLASVLGALVAGHRLESDPEEPLVTGMLALAAPVSIIAFAICAWSIVRPVNSVLGWSLLAAAAVGGACGSVVSLLRSRDEEETFYDRARQSRGRSGAGWR